jgi:hypothetical protein
MIKKLLISLFLIIFGFFLAILLDTNYVKIRVVSILSNYKSFNNENELILDLAFQKNLTSKSILPEIKNNVDLKLALRSFYHSDISIDSLFNYIKITDVNKLDTEIIKITYSISEKSYETYAYLNKNISHKKLSSSLIIPGTGEEVSSKINKNQYVEGSKLDDLLAIHSDCYTLIKPNEDIIAQHHNGKKLNYEFIYINLINKGYSYSKRYIQDGIALTKFLKNNYTSVSTFGISQGGLANLIISEMSEPDFSWICAGYSQLFDDYYFGSQNQIMGEGFNKYYHSNFVNEKFSTLKTKVYFTYGKKDNDFYNYEYNSHHTEKNLKNNKNFNFYYFDGGHDFPLDLVENFAKLNL